MFSLYGMYSSSWRSVKKVWRYPGVPIPYRLRSKYKTAQ